MFGQHPSKDSSTLTSMKRTTHDEQVHTAHMDNNKMLNYS